MTAFILVPGAWPGGWWYQPLVDALEADGRAASALTPAGLGADDYLRSQVINLDTHIEQTVDAVAGATGPVTLVGHSYGGSSSPRPPTGCRIGSRLWCISTPTCPTTTTPRGA